MVAWRWPCRSRCRLDTQLAAIDSIAAAGVESAYLIVAALALPAVGRNPACSDSCTTQADPVGLALDILLCNSRCAKRIPLIGFAFAVRRVPLRWSALNTSPRPCIPGGLIVCQPFDAIVGRFRFHLDRMALAGDGLARGGMRDRARCSLGSWEKGRSGSYLLPSKVARSGMGATNGHR